MRRLSLAAVLLAALIVLPACDSAGPHAIDNSPPVDEHPTDDPPPQEEPDGQWVRQQTPLSERIGGIAFHSDSAGIAVTRSRAPTIISTKDGGATWELKMRPEMNGDVGTFLYFADAARGYIGAEGGAVLQTNDGGETWNARTVADTHRWLLSMAFADDSSGWIGGGGGVLVHTADGGETWERKTVDFDRPIFGIHFMDSETGVFVGDRGAIFRTTDAGDSWTRIYSPTRQMLTDLTFLDASTGIAVGRAGTIIRTTDGGATWTELTSPVSTTLWFVDSGEDGFVIATGEGVILVSNDGGTTWHDESVGAETGPVHVRSARSAWMGSAFGAILKRTTTD